MLDSSAHNVRTRSLPVEQFNVEEDVLSAVDHVQFVGG